MASNPTSKRATYSDDIKAQALLALKACGGSITKAQNQLAEEGVSVPKRTLQHWRDKECGISEAIEQKADKAAPELAQVLRETAMVLAEKLLKTQSRSPVAMATALGITVDKILLLEGAPNSINENRSGTLLTDQERADKLVALIERIGSAGAGPAS